MPQRAKPTTNRKPNRQCQPTGQAMCRCVGGRLLSDVCVCMWLSGCGCMRKQSSSHLTPISTRPTFTPIKHTSYSFYITISISISFPMFAAYFLPVFVVITCCCSNSLQRLYILTIRMFFFFSFNLYERRREIRCPLRSVCL